MSSLHTGQNIRLQENGYWRPAVVIRPAGTDRSYHVRTTKGQEYRRNRLHLMDTNETHSAEISSDEHYTTPPASQVTSEPAPPTVAAPYQTRYGHKVKPKTVMDL